MGGKKNLTHFERSVTSAGRVHLLEQPMEAARSYTFPGIRSSVGGWEFDNVEQKSAHFGVLDRKRYQKIVIGLRFLAVNRSRTFNGEELSE